MNCIEQDCDRAKYSRGMCSLHYNRWYRKRGADEGLREYSKPGRKPQDFVEYRAAHLRLRNARGPATNYWCVDNCGRTAMEWSLMDSAPDVYHSQSVGHVGKPYSLDLMAYEPRCKPCHRIYDGIAPSPYAVFLAHEAQRAGREVTQ